MPKAFNLIKNHIDLKTVIHIVGTNGKGSTGRMIAHSLNKMGFKVGHYSSPHILKFNERIWHNGSDSSDTDLEEAHEKLFKLLGKDVSDGLTYFEYTTLLSLLVFDGYDYIVLEAGLGGEFDATNVVPKDISVITPIGYDHQDFLGESIEEIATTKINSIDKQVLISKQNIDKVYEVARDIAKQKNTQLFLTKELVEDDEKINISNYCIKKNWPKFLNENLETVFVLFKLLDLEFDLEHLTNLNIKGRMEVISGNITVDVGHNPLAANVIADNLDKKKIVLIYNSYKDKDYKKVLEILKPNIKHLERIDVQDGRMVDSELLKSYCIELGIEYRELDSINEDENYLVFGSFQVVEEFLRRYNEK